jgi:outer membrane protein assembly factor BamB
VGSDDRSVYALDGATGKKKWRFETGGAVWSSPCLGPDGTLYVGSNDKNVYTLAAGTVVVQIKETLEKEGSAEKEQIVVEDGWVVIAGIKIPTHDNNDVSE